MNGSPSWGSLLVVLGISCASACSSAARAPGGASGGAGTAGAPPDASGDAAHPQECTMPSIDHLQSWLASQGEGDMSPSGGSLLVAEGDHDVAKVTLNGAD